MTPRLNTVISLEDPADVLAAIPHMLGFHPEHSLVVIIIHDLDSVPRFGTTLRVDLPCRSKERLVAEYLLSGPLKRQRAEAVFTAVVGQQRACDCDDECCAPLDSPETSPTGLPHEALAAVLREVFDEAGVTTVHALWAPEIQAGAEWKCYDAPGCGGILPDPSSSAVAAAMTAAGVVTFRNREELRELIAPEPAGELTLRSAKLDALVEERQDGPEQARRDLQTVFAAIRRTAEGKPLTEEDLLQVLLAVSDSRVRDIALSASLGELAPAAEQLWLTLVRKAPEPEFADVAALLAFAAYLRGEGALASVALERIEQTRPEHRLGTLLRRALDSGITPTELAAVARDAAEDARALLAEGGA